MIQLGSTLQTCDKLWECDNLTEKNKKQIMKPNSQINKH